MMSNWTRFFLVVLRLAIGWHLATEGWSKIQSIRQWSGDLKTYSGRAFTSRGYLLESGGPLRDSFRDMATDPYRRLEARLDTRVPHGKDPKEIEPLERFPKTLGREWDRYLNEFLRHYEVGGDQHEVFRNELGTQKKIAADWLAGCTKDEPKELKRRTLWGEWTVKLTIPQRIDEYRAKLRDIEDVDEERRLFNNPVAADRLQRLKAEAAICFDELTEELDGNEAAKRDGRFQIMQKALEKHLSAEQKKKGAVPGYGPDESFLWGKTKLWWVDRITAYGLFAAGLALILGLFTRIGCMVGAGLLLLFFVARPVLPWLPPAPNSEGTYYWINKTTIEALALLALATTRSGLWLGLDAAIHVCWRRWISKRPEMT
jgi:uncharacterized membrane protein YphA (DoxX/SURF4 family)